MSHIRAILVGLAIPLTILSLPSMAAGVLDNLSSDALGFVVVRNLSRVDGDAESLSKKFNVQLPGPLASLRSFAGIHDGLNADGDLMIVVLPPTNESEPFQLAVWLPVADYDVLVRSLEGDPQREIAAVTISGEDLLVTRHGEWAVVVDPDQRRRLEKLESAVTMPSQLTAWDSWAAEKDITLVALPSGVGTFWAQIAKFDQPPQQLAAPGDPAADELFGPPPAPPTSGEYWTQLLVTCRSLLAKSPELERIAVEARGIGWGIKLDEAGNAAVGFRMTLPEDVIQNDAASSVSTLESPAATSLLPQLLGGDDFIAVGSGDVSPRWSVAAVAPYLHSLMTELATDYGTSLGENEMVEFRHALELAVADVQGFTLLARPGHGQDGVSTNNFLAVRVASVSAFTAHAAEAMKRWNEMFNREGVTIRLVFESAPVTVAGRRGTEYFIDMASAAMAAAFGVQPSPEVRQAMEKIFGPGGKFRLQLIAVDDQTVLLAVATEQQATTIVETLGQTTLEPIGTANDSLSIAEQLLPASRHWQIYFSPSGYVRWLQRQLDAMLGQVIGGPIIRDMPAAPPIGIVGGLAEQTAWIELAVPADTLDTLSKYVRE